MTNSNFTEEMQVIGITVWMQDFLQILKNGDAVEFGAMSETLFYWSKKWISKDN